MFKRFIGLFASLLVAQLAHSDLLANNASIPDHAHVRLPALDTEKLAAEATSDYKGPYLYAVRREPEDSQAKALSDAGGIWTSDPNNANRMIWRAQITAEGAQTLSLQLEPFRLPHSARLRVFGAPITLPGGALYVNAHREITDQDNNPQRSFPTAVVYGDTLTLELHIDANEREFLALGVKSVNHGYRGFELTSEGLVAKAGGCNVDSICPQGNNFRDQIRSVAIYSSQVGNRLGWCTGTLVNTTASTRDPIFLTARHCLSTQAVANTVVVYYRYESASCRALSLGDVGLSDPRGLGLTSQNGAQLLATSARSDVTLLRLNAAVPAAANPYYAGWDRRDAAPSSAVGIHHPSIGEKRISFENDPTSISTTTFSVGDINLVPGTGIRVANWDVGTTEQGSSGSALFSQGSKLVVGTLSGGSALCSTTQTTNNGQPDFYGRLFTGWEGENTASTRLRDHLDPAGSAPQFLAGTENCSAPVVNLTATGAFEAGTDTIYRAEVSGGSAPYRIEWEIDGDTLTDRVSSLNAAGSSPLTVRYNKSTSINVQARVVDAANCVTTVSRAIDVRAPLLSADATATPAQVCGDGDSDIEPGERWSLQTNVRNSSAVAAQGVIAQFTQRNTSQVLSTPDSFGYRYTDSARGSCANSYIDMSAANVLTLTAAPLSLSAQDDGRTATLNIQSPIEVYGESISSLTMSTNGYVILNPQVGVTGGDFRSACGLLPVSDSVGKRLQVFHTDLNAGELRAAAFDICPRPADVATSSTRCIVMDWRRMDVLSDTGVVQNGNFDVQAILYPGAREIVYQYRGNIPTLGTTRAVSGLLNPTVTQSTYSCPGTPQRIASNSSVCFFHPGNLPANSTTSGDALTFARSAAPLGNLANGQSAVARTEFYVNPSASCGSRVTVELLPGFDDRAFSTGSERSYPITIGGLGGCQTATTCAVPTPPAIRGGSFFNPIRPGNGLVSFLIPQSNQPPYFFSNWFVGEVNRNPTWYSVEGLLKGDQVVAPIERITRNVSAPNFSVTRTTVGQAQISVLGRENIVMSYRFNDGSTGGDNLRHLLTGLATANPDLTGHYFNPSQSGWGQTYESFVGSTPSMFILNYIYDGQGQPRWTLSQDADSNTGDLPALYYQAHCPSCAWMDINPTVQNVGTLRRSLQRNAQGNGVGTISTNYTLPLGTGVWQRSSLPVESITPLNAPGN